MPLRSDLDPIVALKAYKGRRDNVFGTANHLPMFLHENGSIYTKSEFNEDLSSLLATYPELSTDRDKWSGHSFRAGLPTILAILGFSPEDIQKWGRWRSDAYLAYLKDQSHRRNVKAKLALTFKNIFSAMQ